MDLECCSFYGCQPNEHATAMFSHMTPTKKPSFVPLPLLGFFGFAGTKPFACQAMSGLVQFGQPCSKLAWTYWPTS